MSSHQNRPHSTPILPIMDLDAFVETTEGLLDNVAFHWSELLFEEGDRNPIRDAWNELKQTVPMIRQGVRTLTQTLLQQAGLFGAQLTAKLNAVNQAWENFQIWGSVKKLKKLLGWTILVLGSLSSILPGAEALQEMAELMEKSINKWDD